MFIFGFFSFIFPMIMISSIINLFRVSPQQRQVGYLPVVRKHARVRMKKIRQMEEAGKRFLQQRYFLTFETDEGHKEFLVPENDYLFLKEGEFGVLKYQGNRYIGFEA